MGIERRTFELWEKYINHKAQGCNKCISWKNKWWIIHVLIPLKSLLNHKHLFEIQVVVIRSKYFVKIWNDFFSFWHHVLREKAGGKNLFTPPTQTFDPILLSHRVKKINRIPARHYRKLDKLFSRGHLALAVLSNSLPKIFSELKNFF